MENKYVIHFLLNSIGKIHKIVVRTSVCFLSYQNPAFISHENSHLFAFSNLALENS